jgi:hypothetical protein
MQLSEALARVRELEAASRWIPVSERLPEIERIQQVDENDPQLPAGQFLALLGDGSPMVLWYGNWQTDGDDDDEVRFGWHQDEDHACRHLGAIAVTHWREIGELPKAEPKAHPEPEKEGTHAS